FMLKYRFLKNSAKVLCVSTGVLLLSNLILLLGLLIPSFEEKIGFLSKLPDLSIYIFTFFSYLALNDEKAAHRKIKDIKSQKFIKALKVILIVIFVSTFFKALVMSNLNGVALNLFLTVTSFTFFMLVLSCWYFYRDKNEGKIKLISLVSIIVSLVYTIFKFVMYQNPVYPLGGVGVDNTAFVNYQAIQYAFCILQYSTNILMLVCINKHYEKKEALAEAEEKAKVKIERPEIIESIENEDGFGIDFIDDGNM
ncbi:MAG: hypothetical protein IJC90_07150, partial [Clostridia bacterium]|nr:hypothetical protein [Clostridia bacterium]